MQDSYICIQYLHGFQPFCAFHCFFGASLLMRFSLSLSRIRIHISHTRLYLCIARRGSIKIGMQIYKNERHAHSHTHKII